MKMRRTTMDDLHASGVKRHSPAAARNRKPIAAVLAKELPASGTVLEVASGTGEHAAYFAALFPDLVWQPSEPNEEAIASIDAYRADHDGENIARPIRLDAANVDSWPEIEVDSIVCINMVHISPWEATQGLFAKAQRLLPIGSPLILYGPYLEDQVETTQSNLEFDANLKARDPRWGLRKIADVDALAAKHGLKRTARYEMPANNLTLVYRRSES